MQKYLFNRYWFFIWNASSFSMYVKRIWMVSVIFNWLWILTSESVEVRFLEKMPWWFTRAQKWGFVDFDKVLFTHICLKVLMVCNNLYLGNIQFLNKDPKTSRQNRMQESWLSYILEILYVVKYPYKQKIYSVILSECGWAYQDMSKT